MPTLSQEEYDKVIGIIAKDEAAQAEQARIAAIEAKNDEPDRDLEAVALRHKKTLDGVTAELKAAEDLVAAIDKETPPEVIEELNASVAEAIAKRAAVIDTISKEAADIEQNHIANNADVYNPQGAG